jgi:hypothetical protein
MSRHGSNNSQVHTPGDGSSLASSDTSVFSERAPVSNPRYTLASVSELRERIPKYQRIGKELKHKRDDVLRMKDNPHRGPPSTSDPDLKIGLMIGIESIMAFMVSFRAQTDARLLEHKAQDPAHWNSLFPLLKEMTHLSRWHKPLYALYVQLNALCLEELLQCYWFYNPEKPEKLVREVFRLGRLRTVAWFQAHEALDKVDDADFRCVIGPGCEVDRTVADVLGVLRRVADAEGVRWREELVLEPITKLGPAPAATNGNAET